MRVFDPIVSPVMQECGFCGKRCYIALNGRTLLDPDTKRERKTTSPHDRVTHEAERHEYNCKRMR